MCGKGFMNRNHLETHTNSHNNLKPHKCSKCHKGFNNKSNMAQHLQTCSLTDRNFECAVCGKKFLSTKNLVKHLRNQHKVK